MDIDYLLDLLNDSYSQINLGNNQIQNQLSEIGISLVEGDKNVRRIERKSSYSKLRT